MNHPFAQLTRSFSRKTGVAISLGLLSLALPGAASADTLNPGSTLTISFTAAPNSSDLLIFASDWGFSATGSSTVTTQLFNGNTLMGTAISPVASFGQQYFENYFAKPGDQYTYDSPTAVDLSSLNNGTINGKLVVTITGGSMSYYQNFYLHDAQSCGSGCYMPAYNVGITSYQLSDSPASGPAAAAAPEPASLTTAGAALVGLFFMGRRRKLKK